MGGKKSRIVPVSGNYVHEFILNKITNNEIVREEEWNILYKEMDRYTPDEALKLYNSGSTKLRNFETLKPGNQKTKKPRNISSAEIHSILPTCPIFILAW